MAPSPTKPSQAPKPTSSPSVPDPESDVDDFLALMSKLSSQGGYKRVKKLTSDHETLESDLADLRVAYTTNLKQLSEVEAGQKQQEREYVEKIKALETRLAAAEHGEAAAKLATDCEERKVKDLRAQVQQGEKKVIQMMDTDKKRENDNIKLSAEKTTLDEKISLLETEERKLNGELSSARSALATKSEELRKAKNEIAAVRSYIVKLPNLEVNRNRICQDLDSAFGAVFHFLSSQLAVDLPENRLEDVAAWDGIRDHHAIRRTIPLPPTNSPAAKRMRVIAALIILAHALVRHVLRPTYLLNQSEELDRMLDGLAKSRAAHDAFVRAVLLKATASGNDDPALARSELALREVATAVQHWIPADRSDQFYNEMRRLTSPLTETWKIVQRTRQRVDPSLSFEVLEDWRQLPPMTTPQDRPQSSAEPSQPPVTLVETDVIGAVWPAFLVREEDTLDIVHQGYVLTRGDVKDASEEATRRGARRNARRSETMNGTNRRDSGVSFLSPGQSNDSPVK